MLTANEAKALTEKFRQEVDGKSLGEMICKIEQQIEYACKAGDNYCYIRISPYKKRIINKAIGYLQSFGYSTSETIENECYLKISW